MNSDILTAGPFRGDPDIKELHRFFQSERQFAGDTLWTTGTSLKSSYLDSFEFLNEPPVVQLWRDEQREVQAVSRITLSAGKWFYLAAPDYRRRDVAGAILEQAETALDLLSAQPSWRTVAYESDRDGASFLEGHGYAADGFAEVYMLRSLDEGIATIAQPSGCVVRLLDQDDPTEVTERGDAQTDAFIEDQPYAEVAAWMRRNLPHQLAYGRPAQHPSVVAIDTDGGVLALADSFLDQENMIGEFEPVGTRNGVQRRGLAKAVLTHCLELMRDAGMRHAVVRTDLENTAAVAAYRSVGFEVTDRLLNYRKHR